MTTKLYDYLIVGQGLAGSILAFRLMESGRSVIVVDNSHYHSSSKIAAGIINPITGHRLNLSENFSTFYPRAKKCYASLEARLGESLISFISQRRLIKNKGQYSYLQKRFNEPEYQDIVLDYQSTSKEFVEDREGSIAVNSTAVVDCHKLMKSMKAFLLSHEAIYQAKLDYTDLWIQPELIKFGSLKSKSIIFCEGAAAINNPWLKELPFKLAKGEIISLELKKSHNNIMLNWGNWVAPTTDHNKIKLGASFDWSQLDHEPSDEVADKLLKSLADHTTLDGEVINHQAGVRPTTKDRKPFIGAIPNFANAYCFNGFGSKGCLTIPYYADLLCDHLLNDAAIPENLSKWL